MQSDQQFEAKKVWNTPRLTFHGSLAEITKDFNKLGREKDYISPNVPLLLGSVVPLP